MDGILDQRQQPQPQQQSSGSSSQGILFADPYVPGVSTRTSATSASYKQTLKFPPANDTLQESESIDLPSIHAYVPPKTDIDAALSLAALYRTHCTSLIDCIRYCKEKQFFRLYASFGGTLTVPVQKLFDHPAMASWIRECDWLMYQKMTYYVSQLTLAVVPPVVLKFLDTISKTLHAHICKIFADRPLHVLEAKLEPATIFTGLLHRMLRVNNAAHAAAVLLMNDQYRDQMWQDWIAFVNPKRIMESELPDCGYDEVYKILTHDVRSLLQPLNTPHWMENGTQYADAAVQAQTHFNPNMSGETVIDRIAAFLADLPTRFLECSARSILHCVSCVGTAALREITVENGTSYNPWWITKVFIDEMGLWLASLGGFLDHKVPATSRTDGQGSEAAVNGIGAGLARQHSASVSRQGSGMGSPELAVGGGHGGGQGSSCRPSMSP